jgi:hypothetical protein
MFGFALLLLAFFFISCDPNEGLDPNNGSGNGPEEEQQPSDPIQISGSLTEGFDFLEDGDYDRAIASFEAAYAAHPNDKDVIVYSALAKLASISIDSNVTTLIRNKLGFTSYPSEMNALLSDTWMKEYNRTSSVWNYTSSVSETGTYVRANGRLLSPNEQPASMNAIAYPAFVWAKGKNSELDWIDGSEYSRLFMNGGNTQFRIEVTELSNDGEFMVYGSYDAVPGTSEKYEMTDTDERVRVIDESWSQNFPGLGLPSWFADTTMYENSLVNGVQTSETLTLLLIANALDGNINGLNDLIDGILTGVFGNSFEEVCARINKLNMNDRIVIPAELITNLGLETLLEEGFDAEIGRAEFQALTSALRLVKGTLQWLASYNLNTDLSFGKFDWADTAAIEALLTNLQPGYDPFANNFLSVRSSTNMAASKESFVKALTDIGASYDYLVSDANESYPPAVKNDMKTYAAGFRDGVKTLITQINSNGTFYVHEEMFGGETPATTWDNTPDGAMFGVDLGKFFTPGTFSLTKLIESENNKPVFFYDDDGDGVADGEIDSTVIASIRDDSTIDSYAGMVIKTTPMAEVMVGFSDFTEMSDTMFIPLPLEVIVPLYAFYYE